MISISNPEITSFDGTLPPSEQVNSSFWDKHKIAIVYGACIALAIGIIALTGGFGAFAALVPLPHFATGVIVGYLITQPLIFHYNNRSKTLQELGNDLAKETENSRRAQQIQRQLLQERARMTLGHQSTDQTSLWTLD